MIVGRAASRAAVRSAPGSNASWASARLAARRTYATPATGSGPHSRSSGPNGVLVGSGLLVATLAGGALYGVMGTKDAPAPPPAVKKAASAAKSKAKKAAAVVTGAWRPLISRVSLHC